MKTVKIALTAIALTLTAAPVASFAAELVDQAPQHQQEIGVVSAGGANSLDGLQSQLAAKAEAAGATSFRINSTTGNNQLHGTAVIYQ